MRQDIAVGGRLLRWNGFDSDQSFAADMLSAVWYPFKPRRVRWFVDVGTGRATTKLAAPWGHHVDSLSATNRPVLALGTGLDIRLFQRVAITPFISSVAMGGADVFTQCANSDYLSGGVTWQCSAPTPKPRLSLRELGIGFGIR